MADKDKSIEQLQREVLEGQLRTQAAVLAREEAALEDTVQAAADRKQKKQVAAQINRNRQNQFASDRANLRNLQKNVCAHMSGGEADAAPTEGGGKFAWTVISCTIMPDGVTKFLQCPRCALKMYWRELSPPEQTKLEAAAAKSPANSKAWLAWDDYLWGAELHRLFRKEGLGKKSVMRGPTFNFQRQDGTSMIPDITGWANAGPPGR